MRYILLKFKIIIIKFCKLKFKNYKERNLAKLTYKDKKQIVIYKKNILTKNRNGKEIKLVQKNQKLSVILID